MSSSDSSDGVLAFAAFLFAAGPLAGGAAYGAIKAKYRNMAAKYRPEKVVSHSVGNLITEDKFIETATSDNSSVDGRNDGSPDLRLPYSKVTKD